MANRCTTEQFIIKAAKVHGDKYSYDKVDYKNSRTKIEIYCKECCKYFLQSPDDHLQNYGCKQCGIRKCRTNSNKTPGVKLDKKEFIRRSILKHSNKFNYDKVVYINSKTNVILLCNICNTYFQQIPIKHMSGRGCKICNRKRTTINMTTTLTEFINRSKEYHGDSYEYDKVSINSIDKNVQIKCKFHNEYFLQSYMRHMNGSGCYKCSLLSRGTIRRTTLSIFIEKSQQIYGHNIFDYSNVNYQGNKTKIKLRCIKHDTIFMTSPSKHYIKRGGCPKCKISNFSVPALQWLKLIEQSFGLPIRTALSPKGEYIISNSRYKADGYCKWVDTILEFHGCYYHGHNCAKYKNYNNVNKLVNKTFGELYDKTIERSKFIRFQGYKLIEIWECEFIELISGPQSAIDEYIISIGKYFGLADEE